MTTMDELRDPSGLFKRSAVMPRPGRKHPHDHRIRIEQRRADVSLHPELPPTPAWTYEGTLPGPVIVVPADGPLAAVHDNDLVGTLPYRHAVALNEDGTAMNDAGCDSPSEDAADEEEAARAAALHAFTVTHLHGAPSEPGSDGWAENVISYGEERRDLYQFGRETWPMTHASGAAPTTFRSGAGPMYWYHDHGMGVTRFNVYAGLAGGWIVRDPLETSLGLPTDSEREIPLVISDRNLDTDDGTSNGRLTGAVLHKVATGVRESFAPVTLVNGLAWPRCEVPRRVVRLRVLNGCNARTLRLHFHTLGADDDGPGVAVPDAAIQQIGTDGGLLGRAVALPAGGLVLAPAERADLLVDFGQLGPESAHVVVWNSAPAPWGPQPGDPAPAPGVADLPGLLPTPHVMRFDVDPGSGCRDLDGRPIEGMALDPAFLRVPTDHDELPQGHEHTLIAMLEEETILRDEHGAPRTDGNGKILTHPMLFLHEMVPQTLADAQGINLFAQQIEIVDPDGDGTTTVSSPAGIRLRLPNDPTTYVTCGKRFNDATRVMATQGAWHQWKILNLSPDTHPFHIHLSQFQAMSRVLLDPQGGPFDPARKRDITLAAGAGADAPDALLDDNEKGWKDTFRVDPGRRDQNTGEVVAVEMVTVLGCFGAHSGRYMYHCHIIEHEDMEMMRQFTVLPANLMAFMEHHH